VSLADGERIAAAAARARGQIVVGFNVRFHRLVARAHELIQTGILGEIDGVTTRFTSPFLYRNAEHPWRRKRALGGGVLFEMAPHHFDLWRHFAGAEVAEVFAVTRSTEWDDESAVLSGRTQEGVMMSSFVSQTGAEANEIEVSGRQGRLSLSLYRFDSLQVTPRETPIGDLRHRLRGVAANLRALPAGVAAARRGGDYLDSYRREWEHLVDVIQHGSSVKSTLEDGLRALEIMIAASESAASGEPVSIPSLLAREEVGERSS
jgi:myo-inositol 2-dehydrogenase / D-chiro-inositol 1-dehydrogenase